MELTPGITFRIEIKLVPCPQVCADVVASLVGSLPSVGPGKLPVVDLFFKFELLNLIIPDKITSNKRLNIWRRYYMQCSITSKCIYFEVMEHSSISPLNSKRILSNLIRFKVGVISILENPYSVEQD